MMTAAYQLKRVPERFFEGQTDLLALARQLGDENLVERLLMCPHLNEPMLPFWGKVTDSWHKLSATSTEKPDISLWNAGCLLLSQRAHQVLHPHLAAAGEFLPISVDGEPMYVFNCLAWGKEDMSLTEKAYLDGYEDGIATLAFDLADVAEKMIFKSKLEAGATLYASEAFKHLVEQAGLQGVRFDTELMDPF